METPLDLAEVGVRDVGELGHVAEGQVGEPSLGADEGPQGLEPGSPYVVGDHLCR